jgi:type I restriction enzyme S subunit
MVETNFKQTEIGLIPEDWQNLKIGEIADIFGGGTPSTTNRSYWNGDIQWFTPTEISGNKYSYKSIRTITKEGLENSSAKILSPGTILLTTRASIGDVSILKVEAATNQGFQSLYARPHIDNEYLYYIITTLKNELLKNSSGSTFLEISPNKLKSIFIALPPTKNEQQDIANALSDADAWIESLEKLIAKKRLIKQGAMQELLAPKEDWEVKKLGDVALNISSGKSNTLSENGLFPIYGSTGIIGYKKYYDYEGQVITIARVGANAGKVNIISGKYCVSDNTIMLKLNDFTNLRYVFNQLIQFNLNRLVFGSGQPLITGTQLKNLEIVFPKNLEEQTRIANILSDMDAEIDVLEQKLQKAQQIKQGMMQQLLTGKIRLIKNTVAQPKEIVIAS